MRGECCISVKNRLSVHRFRPARPDYIGTGGVHGCLAACASVMIIRELCITHISLKRMGFSSVPRLSGWSFQQRICGGVLPPPHCPDKSGPAVSPTDKLRKDSALTPVTSEKSTLFIGVTKIVRFCKALHTHPEIQSRLGGIMYC